MQIFNDGNDELDAFDNDDLTTTANSMNELSEWLNNMPCDTSDLVHYGTIAAGHARLCALEAAGKLPKHVSDEERTEHAFPMRERALFFAWLARLGNDIVRLREIMNQNVVAKFEMDGYRPRVRAVTAAERAAIDASGEGAADEPAEEHSMPPGPDDIGGFEQMLASAESIEHQQDPTLEQLGMEDSDDTDAPEDIDTV